MAVGALMLVNLAVVAAAFRADRTEVYFLGRPLGWVCSFKERFGVPCPTCGVTRSIVLTLHGSVLQAMKLNPAASLLVLGIFGFAILMLVFAWCKPRVSDQQSRSVESHIRRWTLLFCGLAAAVGVAHWAIQLTGL